MREIKFRAWDKVFKVMIDVNVLEWQKFTQHQDILYVRGEKQSDWKIAEKEYQTDSETIKNIEIMQFTGLKDKNGVDIYEGDIGKVTDKSDPTDTYLCQVKWFGESGYPAFDLDGDDWESDSNGLGLAEIAQGLEFQIEVIGNIYENPELLTT
jgi:uncharacterized phage protein (TIGR01671 family)